MLVPIKTSAEINNDVAPIAPVISPISPSQPIKQLLIGCKSNLKSNLKISNYIMKTKSIKSRLMWTPP